MRARWLLVLMLTVLAVAGGARLGARPRSVAQVMLPAPIIVPFTQVPASAERITRLWVTIPANGLVVLSWTTPTGSAALQFPDAQTERAFFLARQHAERKNVLVDRNVLPPVFYVDYR